MLYIITIAEYLGVVAQMQGTTEYLARKPSNEMLSTTISKVVWWLLFITKGVLYGCNKS